MLFNSFQFLIFFPVVTIIYFLLPHKFRWFHLLLASCIFYTAFIPVYILILFFTIIIDYVAGIMIEKATGRKKRLFLAMSIVANVGVLAIFKYYDFFVSNINEVVQGFGLSVGSMPLLNIILPIGLSFHTFQAMSYTIEVYRGNQKAERNLGIYALYIMFYPQLVAGPIERPQNVIHQFYEKHVFNKGQVNQGLKMMLWGLFMKVVIADRLALYVDAVYNNVPEHNGTTLLLATIFFTIQIYCDFAGYSYIAIGAANVMGFKLMTNFNRPYFSRSISEFWSRWHISLSTWFRDYLYIPMGGNRVGPVRRYFNLFFVFLISGLWHGANWTFLIWGALNGFYLVFGILTRNWRRGLADFTGLSRVTWFYQFLQIAMTFALCVFAWIFFRANNLADAYSIVRKIFSDHGKLFMTDDRSVLLYGFFGIFLLMVIEIKREFFTGPLSFFNNQSIYIRYLSYAALLTAILLLGVFDGGQFIYFQF